MREREKEEESLKKVKAQHLYSTTY